MTSITYKKFEKLIVIIKFSLFLFKKKYLGSFLGFLWAFLQPIIFVSILAIIFNAGFKNSSSNQSVVPILYVYSGYMIYDFFSRQISFSISLYRENKFLLYRNGFPFELLPISLSFSNYLHFLINFIILSVFSLFFDSFSFIPFICGFFYTVIIFLLSIPVTFITAFFGAYIKDLTFIIQSLLQIGFWGAPIFWDINLFDLNVQKILYLHPISPLINFFRSITFNYEIVIFNYVYLYIFLFFLMLWIIYFVFLKFNLKKLFDYI